MAKKKPIELHAHRECARAKLIHYDPDPLIAQCDVDGDRHVASTYVACPYFKPRTTEANVEHKEKI